MPIFLPKYGITIYLHLPDCLTINERNIFKLLAQGKTVTEIAKLRSRSIKTISAQKQTLYTKLGIHSDRSFWLNVLLQYSNIFYQSNVKIR